MNLELLKSENQCPPTIIVKQRMLLKRTTYECKFFNGYSEVTYENPKVAKKVFDSMKANKQKVELEENTIKECRKGLSAWQIFELYMNDINNAMKKNNFQSKIEYELT